MNSKIGIQVKELLKLEAFKGVEVLTGEVGLHNVIKGVNVLEVPDAIQWLREGDFILTTAYPVKDDKSQLKKFFFDLHDQGVACVAIKVKRYIDEVPSCVLEAAKDMNLPILSIPYEASFGELMNEVLTKIVNRQTDLLLRMNSFNNSIKDAMLRGGDLLEIAKMISEQAGTPLGITDAVFNDFVVFDESPLKKHFEMITEKALAESAKQRSSFVKFELKTVTDEVDGEEIERYIIPICSTDTYYGDLYLWDKKEDLSQEMLTMIEGAASLIALNFAKKLSVYDNENNHKMEFIEDLISDDPHEKQRAIDKANYFDFNKTSLYRVLIVKSNELDVDIAPTPNNQKIIKELENKIISISKRMERLYDGDLIYANKSNRVVFLLGFEYKSSAQVIREYTDHFVKTILDLFEKEGLHASVSIGIGRPYSDYKMLNLSYREALRAVQRLELSPNKQVMHYDDLGIYRILSHEEIRDDILQFAKEQLGDLMEYDRLRDADLIKTLTAYFEAGGNVKRVSETLFTHYNTVIYRMQRIKEIAGIDLEDADMMLNLQIALKIMEVIDTEQ